MRSATMPPPPPDYQQLARAYADAPSLEAVKHHTGVKSDELAAVVVSLLEHCSLQQAVDLIGGYSDETAAAQVGRRHLEQRQARLNKLVQHWCHNETPAAKRRRHATAAYKDKYLQPSSRPAKLERAAQMLVSYAKSHLKGESFSAGDGLTMQLMHAAGAAPFDARLRQQPNGEPAGSIVAPFGWPVTGLVDTIVHMAKVEPALEKYLPQLAIKTSPLQKHVAEGVLGDRVLDALETWWLKYQPDPELDPFELTSSIGTDAEVQRFIDKAHRAGLRIYADLVFNHATSFESGTYTDGRQFTAEAVRSKLRLNQNGDITNWDEEGEQEYNDLCGLPDRATGALEEQLRMAWMIAGMTLGRDLHRPAADGKGINPQRGLDGFRLDAVKHMPELDINRVTMLAYAMLNLVYDRLETEHAAKGGTEPLPRPKPFIYGEHIGHGWDHTEEAQEADSLPNGSVTNVQFGKDLTEVVMGKDFHRLLTFTENPAYVPPDKAVVFRRNHDSSRRSHVNLGAAPQRGEPLDRLEEACCYAKRYGTKFLHTGFYDGIKQTDENQGEPALDGRPLNPYDVNGEFDPTKTADDGRSWTMDHVDPFTVQMVLFDLVCKGTSENNQVCVGNHIAGFGCGRPGEPNRGYFIGNNGEQAATLTVQTGLAPGSYLDVYHTALHPNQPRYVEVNADGTAELTVPPQGAVMLNVEKR